MSRNEKKPQNSQADNALISKHKSDGPDASKRRLLRRAVGTTPILLAVSSKPTLAAWCTVSGFLSGNLSQPTKEEYCGGLSPGYWIGPNGIPESDKTLFRNIFGGLWYGKYHTKWSIVYDADGNEIGPTLRDVLAMDGTQDRYQFGAHAVAAYMNAMNSAGGYMPATQVIKIVNDVITQRYYTDPTTQLKLNARQVVRFFQQTFDAG